MSNPYIPNGNYAITNFRSGLNLSLSTTTGTVQGQNNLQDWWIVNSTPSNWTTIRHGGTCGYLTGTSDFDVVVGDNHSVFGWFVWTSTNRAYHLIAYPGSSRNVGLPSLVSGTSVTLDSAQYQINGSDADATQFWQLVPVQQTLTCH